MLIGIGFWACGVASVALSVLGVARRSPFMLAAAAVLAAPVSFYLGASPLFRSVGFFLPVLQLGAALVVRRWRPMAIILVSPGVALALWLASVVFGQSTSIG